MSNDRQALQALVEVIAPMIERDLTFVSKTVVITFDTHDDAITAVAVARDMLRGARKALASPAGEAVQEQPQPVQPLSEHEVTMAVETAWEATEQEILDGEPPRYGEHVATLIQHACATAWGVQLGDTGTKEKQ